MIVKLEDNTLNTEVHNMPEKEKIDVKLELSEEKAGKIDEICASFNNEAGELINVLHQTQNTYGYLPAEVQELIAKNLKISVAQVYGVVTFYSYFSMVPKGEYPISVCLGTACYVRGAEKILDEFKRELSIGVGETTSDNLFSISCLRCVGACGLAPVVMVGEKVYGRVSPDKVREIIEEYRPKE